MMPPMRTYESPDISPQRPTSLASIPFRFRRKSLSEDELPMFPSPSLSPSLSTSMSSSPPPSPTVLATSPTRPSHLDSAKVLQPSSPLRSAAYHAYGYSYTYPRGGSHPLSQDHDLLSADHPSKPFPPRPHAYAVIPPSATKHSTRPTYSSLSPSDLDDHSPFYSSASECGNHLDFVCCGMSSTSQHDICCSRYLDSLRNDLLHLRTLLLASAFARLSS
ncbi:hypothetical protein PYCCODRAFT_1253008 [Trametes coccinea BRFM310]|uniref:Uncharacterized protein n=1 Tax=Trametes coccinea (strain BRFM310) TaxID=1353009 RepID=A0A1Y2I6I0_TRAC3|nr:hypothetical protein PYCCODRAFT_1253008 [Trametes coccinea BRFM310]